MKKIEIWEILDSDEDYLRPSALTRNRPRPKTGNTRGGKLWPCRKCNMVFATCRLFRSHRKTHSKSRVVRPQLRTEKILDIEEDYPRRGRKLWPCKKCDMVFATCRLFRTHRKTHSKPRVVRPQLNTETIEDNPTYKFDSTRNMYVCNVCPAEYKDEAEAEDHIKAHKEIFKCPVCDEIFNTAYAYATHMLKHSDDKTLECYYCSFTTLSRGGLLVHINGVHLKKFHYACEKCGKGFNNQFVLKEHEHRHLGLRPYSCEVCSRTFIYLKHLRAHQVQSHYVRIEGVTLPNQCSVCKKIFGRPVTLEKHYQEEHVGIKKNYLCDLCGKGYAGPEKLRIHYRTHTGDKPFSCSHCAKSFTKKHYMEMHERIHTGEKPYSCEYCEKSFTQKVTLKIHERTHTGERPYVCNACSTGFTSRTALTLHLRSCRRKQR